MAKQRPVIYSETPFYSAIEMTVAARCREMLDNYIGWAASASMEKKRLLNDLSWAVSYLQKIEAHLATLSVEHLDNEDARSALWQAVNQE